MAWYDVGAAFATMATGASAVTAAYVWTQGQLAERWQRRDAIRLRTWSGYIDIGGINAWRVRLVEEPTEPTSRVVVEIIDEDGRPRENAAHNMRQFVLKDAMLARVASPADYAYLIEIGKQRRQQGGFPIGR